MILFLGDSFTWGQGLEWEVLKSKGWSSKDINKLIPPKHSNEKLPIDLYDYRVKHHFPRLVSEYFNESYHIGKFGNGGSNGNIYHILNNISQFIIPENLDLIVIQLTHSSRHIKASADNVDSVIPTDAKELELVIKSFEKKYKWIKIVILSWLPELGDEVKELLGNKYVVKFGLQNGFEHLLQLHNGFQLDASLNVSDGHFNSAGHKHISEYIINHIKEYNIIIKNDFYETKGQKIL